MQFIASGYYNHWLRYRVECRLEPWQSCLCWASSGLFVKAESCSFLVVGNCDFNFPWSPATPEIDSTQDNMKIKMAACWPCLVANWKRHKTLFLFFFFFLYQDWLENWYHVKIFSPKTLSPVSKITCKCFGIFLMDQCGFLHIKCIL